jgi:hypothetical protein
VNADTTGVTFTCTATSAGGTSTQSVTVKRDATPPSIVINIPASGASFLLNAQVLASYSCDGGVSGSATCSGPIASGASLDTASVGSKGFSVNATDGAGNSAVLTHNYSVLYDFVGLLAPISNLPTINKANAGRTIPVKWQLKDASAAFVSNLGSLVSLLSAPIACDAAPTTIVQEELTSPGSTVFRFDVTTNQFIFNWQTEKSWNGCRLLQLQLADGTYHYAKFSF